MNDLEFELWEYMSGSTAGGDMYARSVTHLVRRGKTLCGRSVGIGPWMRDHQRRLRGFGEGPGSRDEFDCRRCAKSLASGE